MARKKNSKTEQERSCVSASDISSSQCQPPNDVCVPGSANVPSTSRKTRSMASKNAPNLTTTRKRKAAEDEAPKKKLKVDKSKPSKGATSANPSTSSSVPSATPSISSSVPSATPSTSSSVPSATPSTSSSDPTPKPSTSKSKPSSKPSTSKDTKDQMASTINTKASKTASAPKSKAVGPKAKEAGKKREATKKLEDMTPKELRQYKKENERKNMDYMREHDPEKYEKRLLRRRISDGRRKYLKKYRLLYPNMPDEDLKDMVDELLEMPSNTDATDAKLKELLESDKLKEPSPQSKQSKSKSSKPSKSSKVAKPSIPSTTVHPDSDENSASLPQLTKQPETLSPKSVAPLNVPLTPVQLSLYTIPTGSYKLKVDTSGKITLVEDDSEERNNPTIEQATKETSSPTSPLIATREDTDKSTNLEENSELCISTNTETDVGHNEPDHSLPTNPLLILANTAASVSHISSANLSPPLPHNEKVSQASLNSSCPTLPHLRSDPPGSSECVSEPIFSSVESPLDLVSTEDTNSDENPGKTCAQPDSVFMQDQESLSNPVIEKPQPNTCDLANNSQSQSKSLAQSPRNFTHSPTPVEDLPQESPASLQGEDLSEKSPLPTPVEDLSEKSPLPTPVENLSEKSQLPTPVEDLREESPVPVGKEDLPEKSPIPEEKEVENSAHSTYSNENVDNKSVETEETGTLSFTTTSCPETKNQGSEADNTDRMKVIPEAIPASDQVTLSKPCPIAEEPNTSTATNNDTQVRRRFFYPKKCDYSRFRKLLPSSSVNSTSFYKYKLRTEGSLVQEENRDKSDKPNHLLGSKDENIDNGNKLETDNDENDDVDSDSDDDQSASNKEQLNEEDKEKEESSVPESVPESEFNDDDEDDNDNIARENLSSSSDEAEDLTAATVRPTTSHLKPSAPPAPINVFNPKEIFPEIKKGNSDDDDNESSSFSLLNSRPSSPELKPPLYLDYDEETKIDLVPVADCISQKLRREQAEGVKFMYQNCFKLNKGALLAHWMGLGKTLQGVALIHTALTNGKCKKVLIICPLSIVTVWKNELKKWLKETEQNIPVTLFYEMDSSLDAKREMIQNWKSGVAIIHYNLFRSLVWPDYLHGKKRKNLPSNSELSLWKAVQEFIIEENTGVDLVICDEGHKLKNNQTQNFLAVNKLETKRRVIMSGTPLQNNLQEFYTMISIIDKDVLGTPSQFKMLFIDPINKGIKSTLEQEVVKMQGRVFALFNEVQELINRQGLNVLRKIINCKKYEFVINVNLTPLQKKLYKYYWEKYIEQKPGEEEENDIKKKIKCFVHFSQTGRICCHPKALVDIDFDRSTVMKGINRLWYKEVLSEEEEQSLKTEKIDPSQSGKLIILQEIVNACIRNQEKVVIFSQFQMSLDIIQDLLKQWDNKGKRIDFFRIDGKTSSENREKFCENFNNPNSNKKVMLVSTEAGGEGINLVGANRVVLFDPAWNPSKDVQSIFRVYRFGQKKNVFVYRLIAAGTREERKINEQISKLALASSVVDKHSIKIKCKKDKTDNTGNEQEDPDKFEYTEKYLHVPKKIVNLDKDILLKKVVNSRAGYVKNFYKFTSHLEENLDSALSDIQQTAALEDLENDRQSINPRPVRQNEVSVISSYGRATANTSDDPYAKKKETEIERRQERLRQFIEEMKQRKK